MIKLSNEHIPCTYCDADALPDTDPPVCADHLDQRKTASENAATLKELDADDGTVS